MKNDQVVAVDAELLEAMEQVYQEALRALGLVYVAEKTRELAGFESFTREA